MEGVSTWIWGSVQNERDLLIRRSVLCDGVRSGLAWVGRRSAEPSGTNIYIAPRHKHHDNSGGTSYERTRSGVRVRRIRQRPSNVGSDLQDAMVTGSNVSLGLLPSLDRDRLANDPLNQGSAFIATKS